MATDPHSSSASTVPASAGAPPLRAPQASPGFLYASLRVFDLSVGEMLWSRRTVFMGLLVGVPVMMALILRLVSEMGAGQFSINNVPMQGPQIFGVFIWLAFVRFIVPVLGVFYGTSLIADEVEDKTITYLFSRPIPRGAVLVGKYFAYMVATVFVVLPSVVVVWLIVVPMFGGSLGSAFIDLLKDLAVLALGLAAYGAVFALAGAVLKRPLLIGLVYVLGWEMIVMAIPGYLGRFTVSYWLQGLVPHAMPSDSPLSLVQSLFQEVPSLPASLAALTFIIVISLWLAARAVTRREYVLEQ